MYVKEQGCPMHGELSLPMILLIPVYTGKTCKFHPLKFYISKKKCEIDKKRSANKEKSKFFKTTFVDLIQSLTNIIIKCRCTIIYGFMAALGVFQLERLDLSYSLSFSETRRRFFYVIWLINPL